MQQQVIQEQRQRPRPTFRAVEVRKTARITPHVVRVTLGGPELEGYTSRGPASHIKVFFPKDGERLPVMPTWGPNGPVMAEGRQRPTSRTYTPLQWRPDALELDVDFLVHGEGPGSQWAERAKPGDMVVISGPGSAHQPNVETDWCILAGDESALPAISTILESLPATLPTRVYIEVANKDEVQTLNGPSQLQVEWLERGSDTESIGAVLLDTLVKAPFPEGNGSVWVGCEASVMRSIRAHLLNDRGLDRSMIHTQGYWKYGALNHPDHDMGD